MKRGAKLAVLTVALAVLVAAWLLAESMTRHREEQQAVEAAVVEHADLSVGAYANVTALSWNYLGNTVNLTRENGTWVNADDGTCPIDQDAVAPLIEAVSKTTANGQIGDVTDFDQYGLALPAITVLAAAGDNIVTYEVGNMTADGGYYVRVNGDESVYTETGLLAPAFQTQLDALLALETVPADMTRVTGLEVNTKGETYTIEYMAGGSPDSFTDEYTWFLSGAGEASDEPVDSQQAKSLYELATDIRLDTCVTWNAKDPAEYGLDDPQGRVRVIYLDTAGNSQDYVLEFGDYTDDSYVYARLAGSKMVYLVSGVILDGLMYPAWETMGPMNICPLNWQWLESILIERDGEEYEILRSVSTPMQEGEEPENIYTVGQRSLDAGAVDSWLGAVHDLTADSAAQPMEGREELFRLTFRQDNERFPEVTLTVWSYDSAHVLCAVNETGYYLLSRTAAASLWDEAEAFLTAPPEPA